MAIKFVKEKKRQKYLILVFLAVFLITGIILGFSFFREKKAAPLIIVIPPREIKINFEVLEDLALKKLQPFKEVFPFEAEPGKENPFLPY